MFSSANRDDFYFEKNKLLYISTDRTIGQIPSQKPHDFLYNIDLPKDNVYKRIQLLELDTRLENAELAPIDHTRLLEMTITIIDSNTRQTLFQSVAPILINNATNIEEYISQISAILNTPSAWSGTNPVPNNGIPWSINYEDDSSQIVITTSFTPLAPNQKVFFTLKVNADPPQNSPLFGINVSNYYYSTQVSQNSTIPATMAIYVYYSHFPEIRVHCSLADNNGDDVLGVIYPRGSKIINYKPLDSLACSVGLTNNRSDQLRITLTDQNDNVIPEYTIKHPVRLTLKLS